MAVAQPLQPPEPATQTRAYVPSWERPEAVQTREQVRRALQIYIDQMLAGVMPGSSLRFAMRRGTVIETFGGIRRYRMGTQEEIDAYVSDRGQEPREFTGSLRGTVAEVTPEGIHFLGEIFEQDPYAPDHGLSPQRRAGPVFVDRTAISTIPEILHVPFLRDNDFGD